MNTEEDKEYPVLHVLHGIFGTQNDMNNSGITIQNMMTAVSTISASTFSDKCKEELGKELGKFVSYIKEYFSGCEFSFYINTFIH